MSTEKKDKKKKSGGGAALILALLAMLGIGGGVGLGGGAGIGGLLGNGKGDATQAPTGNGSSITVEATTAAPTEAPTTPAETVTDEQPSLTAEAPVLEIVIKGKILTVEQEEVDIDGLKAKLQSVYKDGMEIRLIDRYADNELYQQAAAILKELTIDYTEKVEK